MNLPSCFEVWEATPMLSSAAPDQNPSYLLLGTSTVIHAAAEELVKPGPDNRKHLITSFQHATLCLATFVIGFGSLPPILPDYPTPSTNLSNYQPQDLITATCTTALPFPLGAILAAAFLDPALRYYSHSSRSRFASRDGFRITPCHLLALAQLLMLLGSCLPAVGAVLSRPLPISQPWGGSLVAVHVGTVVCHLLRGAGTTTGLAVTMALITKVRDEQGVRSREKTARGELLLHGIGGCFAVGVAGRLALICDMVGSGSVGVAELLMLLLSVASIGLLVVLVPRADRRVRVVTGTTAADAEKGRAVARGTDDALGFEKGCLVSSVTFGCEDEEDLLSVCTSQAGAPRPPDRGTILAAIIAFTYHASTVCVPPALTFLFSDASITTAAMVFWAAIAASRFMVPVWGRFNTLRTVSSIISGLLLLVWLYQSTAKKGTAAAVLAGLMLGPIYPWTVDALAGEMSEDEQLNGMSIIFAFGTSGMAAALFTMSVFIQLTASSTSGA